jgi:hypothetical protein
MIKTRELDVTTSSYEAQAIQFQHKASCCYWQLLAAGDTAGHGGARRGMAGNAGYPSMGRLMPSDPFHISV